MLGLPKATELNKMLPKKAIFAKSDLNTAARSKLDGEISRITIVNEITTQTVNIPAGESVNGIYVLLVALKRKEFDPKSIELLAKLISQKILFVLEYDGMCRLAVCRGKVLMDDWKPVSERRVELKGLNLDRVPENWIRAIEGGAWSDELTLDENLRRNEQKAKLQKEIERLEKQARNENQPNRKFELAQKINKLKKEAEGI